MIEVADTYLGNLNDNLDLSKAVAGKSCLEVELNIADCHKGRIYSHTKNGVEIGIIKERNRALRSGDLFKTDNDKIVKIVLQDREVLVLDISQIEPVCAVEMIRLGHMLGNHHYPIEIRDRQILVKLNGNKSIIKKAIANLNIPGLQISCRYISELNKITWTEHSH